MRNNPERTEPVVLKIIQSSRSREYVIKRGTTLLEALKAIGVFVPSPCGGNGKCGKCKIRMIEGSGEEVSSEELNRITAEEIDQGYRLACRVVIDKDTTVECSPVWEYCDRSKDIDSTIQPYEYGVKERGIHTRTGFGAAVDVGTTTVVLYLVDMVGKAVVDTESRLNPQTVNGADVVSRIDYASRSTDNLDEMRSLMVEELNSMLQVVTKRNRLNPDSVEKMVISGNTTMLHLLLGLDVSGLGIYPYTPVFTGIMQKNSGETGIHINPEGEITILPSVSAFIGADTAAGIISTGMYRDESCNILIDLGTNGEMAAGNKNRMFACSAAAGPAFEGGGIEFGTACVEGAINRVSIGQKGVSYSTIGDAEPLGLCGSGIIDVTAGLLKAEIIDSKGRMHFLGDVWHKSLIGKFEKRLIVFKGKPAFRIAFGSRGKPILFTQEDVRQVQLAKAAVAAGIEVLMNKAGLGNNDVQKVYLAGGFGNYMDIDNAVKIGLIPEALKDKIVWAGNTSVNGALKCLVYPESAAECKDAAGRIESIDLGRVEGFNDLYISKLNFA